MQSIKLRLKSHDLVGILMMVCYAAMLLNSMYAVMRIRVKKIEEKERKRGKFEDIELKKEENK